MANAKKTKFLVGIQQVFLDKDYRAIFFALFLIGFAVGLIIPYVTLWGVNTLGVSQKSSALLFVPMAGVGLIIGLTAANISDRIGKRKSILLLTLLLGAAVRITLAFVDTYTIAMILFAVTGFSPFPFIFALLNDLIKSKEKNELNNNTGTITGTQRLSFSFGWLLGPGIGSIIISNLDFNFTFLISGTILLLTFIFISFRIAEPKEIMINEKNQTNQRQRNVKMLVPLSLISIAAMLIFSGDYSRSIYLPLYVTDGLMLAVSFVGVLFTITALCEIFFMPFSGYLSDRYGVSKVFYFGISSQVLYFLLLPMSSNILFLGSLQILYAFTLSITMGVGIVFVQNLFPQNVGLVTSAYLSMIQVSPLIVSVVLGTILEIHGFSFLFMINSGLTIFAVLLLMAIHKRRSDNTNEKALIRRSS